MSKQKNILYICGLALLMLTGCGQDFPPAAPDEGRQVEIKLTAGMLHASVSVETRTLHDDNTAFFSSLTEPGSGLGLYGLRRQTDPMTSLSAYIHNQPLTATAEGIGYNLTGSQKIYFPTQKNDEELYQAFLYAYAPRSEAMEYDEAGNALLPVKGGWSDQNDAPWTDATGDPLWAAAEATYDPDKGGTQPTATASMAFTHRMAQLQLNIYNPQADGSLLLQGVEVTFSQPQHGYMNLRDGSVTAAAAEPAVTGHTYRQTFTGVTFQASQPTDPGCYQCIHSVLPGSEIREIRICVNEEWHTASLPQHLLPIVTAQGETILIHIPYRKE